MTPTKKAAPGRAAAWKPWHSNTSRHTPDFKRADAIIADDLITKSIEAAETLLSAGVLDPVALNDVAFESGLTGAHFTDDLHSSFFAYLCVAADHGIEADLSHFVTVATDAGIDVELADLDFIFEMDALPRALPLYCEAVIDFARKRDQATTHLREFVKVAALDDFIVDIRLRWEAPSSAKLPGSSASVRTSRGKRTVQYV